MRLPELRGESGASWVIRLFDVILFHRQVTKTPRTFPFFFVPWCLGGENIF